MGAAIQPIASIAGGLIGGFGSSAGARTGTTSYNYSPAQKGIQNQTAGTLSQALTAAGTPYNSTPEYDASLNRINQTYNAPQAQQGLVNSLASRGFSQSGLVGSQLLGLQMAGMNAKSQAASDAGIYSNEQSLSRMLQAAQGANQFGFAQPGMSQTMPGSTVAGALSGGAGGFLQGGSLASILKNMQGGASPVNASGDYMS